MNSGVCWRAICAVLDRKDGSTLCAGHGPLSMGTVDFHGPLSRGAVGFHGPLSMGDRGLQIYTVDGNAKFDKFSLDFKNLARTHKGMHTKFI